MNINIIYTCYSPHLKQYLINNDCKYILCGLNPSTKKTFWVFERNQKLNNLLENWLAHRG